jgi:hypothetical protein
VIVIRQNFGEEPGRRGGDGPALEHVQATPPDAPLHVLWRSEQTLQCNGRFSHLSCLVRIEQAAFSRGFQAGPDHAVALHLGRSRYDGFAQAASALDHHSLGPAQWIDGEGHARRIARDHRLDDHGHPRGVRRDAALAPVGHGTLSPERNAATADGVEQGFLAADVQEGVLLAGERCGSEVLRRG